MTNCILVSRPSDPPCRYRHLLARLVDRHAQRCNDGHEAIIIDWAACKLGSLICSDRGLYCRGGIYPAVHTWQCMMFSRHLVWSRLHRVDT